MVLLLGPILGNNTLSAESVFFFFPFTATPQHMEVPRGGVELELQLLPYDTAIATPDVSCTCDLNNSSQQHWILNSLSEARDGTRIIMDTSRARYCWATVGTSRIRLMIHFSINDRYRPQPGRTGPLNFGKEIPLKISHWWETFKACFNMSLHWLLSCRSYDWWFHLEYAVE